MKKHIQYRVGNGKSTFMWHDKWWEGGVLSNMIPTDEIIQSNLCWNAKVSEMLHNGEWLWTVEWELKYPFLQTIPKISTNNDNEDSTIWVTKKGHKGTFSISKVWMDWNEINETMPWWNEITC